MKQQKDIFDLIKDNEHKLHTPPSERTWRRLERRLDSRTQSRPASVFRMMSWAAAVAALAVMAVLISLVFSGDDAMKPPFAKADREPVPRILEELSVSAEAIEEVASMDAFRRKYESRLSSPIAEGEGHKKLIAHTFDHRGPVNESAINPNADSASIRKRSEGI